MGDFGIKIVKDGKSLTSTNPNDYIYWSKYNGLSLLSTIDITSLAEGDTSGTATYAHGLSYTPFVIGRYGSCSLTRTLSSNKEILPISVSGPINDSGTTAYDPDESVSFTPMFVAMTLSYSVDSTNITFNWALTAFQGGGGYAGHFTNWTGGDVSLTGEFSIYTFDMSRVVT